MEINSSELIEKLSKEITYLECLAIFSRSSLIRMYL